MESISPWMGMNTSSSESAEPQAQHTQRSFGNMRNEFFGAFKHPKKQKFHLPKLDIKERRHALRF